MKKYLLFVLFLLPVFVRAESLTLLDLEIKNGELSPVFQSLNNTYTISLERDVYNVDFSYKVEEGVTVAIINNYDLENNSNVSLELSKGEMKSHYSFNILKEEEETKIVFKEEGESDFNVMYEYKIFVIPICCFILILITYKILFHKHKK